MDDVEAIRQRKLRELQARQAATTGQDPGAAEAEARAQQDALEQLLQQVLEPEARERLTRIRMSRPDLAAEVSQQLVSLARSGRLARRLTDAELRTVLAQLAPQDRDIKITRK